MIKTEFSLRNVLVYVPLHWKTCTKVNAWEPQNDTLNDLLSAVSNGTTNKNISFVYMA